MKNNCFKASLYSVLVTSFLLVSSCQKPVYLNRNNAYSNNEISRYDNPGPVYRKSNLGLLLLGKNRWEVQEIIGEPNGRSLNQRNEHVWDYRRAAIDDTSGEIFEWSLITLTFTTGKCSKIDLKLQRSPPELQKP